MGKASATRRLYLRNKAVKACIQIEILSATMSPFELWEVFVLDDSRKELLPRLSLSSIPINKYLITHDAYTNNTPHCPEKDEGEYEEEAEIMEFGKRRLVY
ncbi:hypothetical protein L1887_03342 [Cichorium endivia]|nr:hypothetical protein L1887_03342 [Cichorium endivia]